MFKLVLAAIGAWGAAGFFAVLGSILGNAVGKSWLPAGAIVGGLVGIAVAVEIAIRFRWLGSGDRRGSVIGGLLGFAIAIPIAVTNLHTPVIPVLACGLAGAGVLLGMAAARRSRRNS